MFYINHFNNKHLSACLYTGHAITRNEDPIKMLKELNGHISALHIHSNIFHNDLHMPPLFIDNVDWHVFYNTLKDIGYKGTFNMEIYAPMQMNFESTLLYYKMVYSIAKQIINS